MNDLKLLHELYLKSDYALNSAEAARHAVNHPAGLWYHAIGLLNALYSIKEEMINRTKNAGDTILSEAIHAWYSTNREKLDAFYINARNGASHQGDIKIESDLFWETDHVNDTAFPFSRVNITINKANITQWQSGAFIDHCVQALSFMRDGIIAIDADYRERGGKQHALPPEIIEEDLF